MFDCWKHLLRQQDFAVLILAVHLHPGLTNISSVIPTCDTATDTITDMRIDGWDRCVASWYRLAHKPDRSAG